MLAPNPQMESILAAGSKSAWRNRLLLGVVAAVAIGMAAGLIWWLMAPAGEAPQYETVAVQRRELTVRIAATGAVQAVNQVVVGSELSGVIRSVLVDYNDRVKAGQAIAELDRRKLEAQADHALAALDVARANRAQAEIAAAQAGRDLERMKSLAAGSVVSQKDLEVAQTAHDRAEAALDAAQAQVKLAEADLAGNQSDLAKTIIVSPINGMVLQRNVDPGQTVAASLQAPVLFVIVEDLAKMSLLVDIDEADAAKVKQGDQASFTVEAFADRRFDAEVAQIRYYPTTISGVVTYKAVLSVDNTDLALRPGMTATAEIVIARRPRALLISNSALRFTPTAPASQPRSFFGLFGGGRTQTGGVTQAPLSPGSRRVWLLADGEARPVLVRVGESDGAWTEILGGAVDENSRVITDIAAAR